MHTKQQNYYIKLESLFRISSFEMIYENNPRNVILAQ